MKVNILRLVMVLMLSLVQTIDPAFGEEILFESKETTQAHGRLTFTLEKAEWNGTDLFIWGTVENTGNQTYKRVQVSITLKDGNRDVIASQTWYVEPDTIAPGEVGYLENRRVDCNGRKPFHIHYETMGVFSRGRVPR